MPIYFKKYTDLSQPLVFEKRKVAYHMTWTNLSQPQEGRKENRNVNISQDMDQSRSASVHIS